jgi:hypothetical protein
MNPAAARCRTLARRGVHHRRQGSLAWRCMRCSSGPGKARARLAEGQACIDAILAETRPGGPKLTRSQRLPPVESALDSWVLPFCCATDARWSTNSL